ncbi:hypothetical protein ABZ572_33785 [Streptomyces sp. NPDC018338]|uniref:hypothetical protein n=1 Tax=Streptomyces sp. NPDC018338 TaxID=3157192 RepID=UPI0033ECFBE3
MDLRAAVVVTRNKALLSHFGRDRFERMAMSSDPVGEVVMLFYTSLLALVEAPHEQTSKLVKIAQDRVHRAGLPGLPDEETYRRVRDHPTVMGQRFRRNALAIASPRSPLRPVTGLQPSTGYSAFAELRTPREDFLQWAVRCGRSGLRLNPTVVHPAAPPRPGSRSTPVANSCGSISRRSRPPSTTVCAFSAATRPTSSSRT